MAHYRPLTNQANSPGYSPISSDATHTLQSDSPVEHRAVYEREYGGRLASQVAALQATMACMVNIVSSTITRIMPGGSSGHLR